MPLPNPVGVKSEIVEMLDVGEEVLLARVSVKMPNGGGPISSKVEVEGNS